MGNEVFQLTEASIGLNSIKSQRTPPERGLSVKRMLRELPPTCFPIPSPRVTMSVSDSKVTHKSVQNTVFEHIGAASTSRSPSQGSGLRRFHEIKFHAFPKKSTFEQRAL